MNRNAITIKHIAKALGISASTVSRALRDSYEISIETKKKVQAYAEEFNYRPNLAALSLRKGKSKTIGVIVSDVTNSYFSQIIDGMESVANSEGYNIIIGQSKDSSKKERLVVEDFSSRSVDGLIISLAAETTDYSLFEEINDHGTPIVFIDRIAEEMDTHKVVADNFTGGYEAVKHLAGNGYRKIALLANNKNLSITTERIKGCRKAFEELGLELNDKWVQFCAAGGSDIKETEAAITNLLKLKGKPDALLTLSDTLSLRALRILREKKIKIPEDIALMGFSNYNNADLLHPSMSVIYQPTFEMGELAAKLLIHEITSKRPTSKFGKHVLSTKMISRKSSAPRHSKA